MTIVIDSRLEARLLDRAQAEGLTVTAYLEKLLDDDRIADSALETLALEGLNSGESIEAGPGYWEQKHRRLDERLREAR